MSPENQSMALMLGEMRGQLRELVHQVANLAQKFEDVAKTADATKHLPDLIAENKARIAALDARVVILEAAESERRGAVKLTEWAIRVIPFAAIGAGFAFTAKMVGL